MWGFSQRVFGEVAERLMAPLSKSGILSKNGIVGSNPTLSAKYFGPERRFPLN